MDLEMPVMDGYAATREIKACCPHSHVIALTIYSHSDARRKAQQAGADDFIEKGAPLEVLTRAIQQLTTGEKL
jgi:DNA-binding NarL/FixJ family response regulator